MDTSTGQPTADEDDIKKFKEQLKEQSDVPEGMVAKHLYGAMMVYNTMVRTDSIAYAQSDLDKMVDKMDLNEETVMTPIDHLIAAWHKRHEEFYMTRRKINEDAKLSQKERKFRLSKLIRPLPSYEFKDIKIVHYAEIITTFHLIPIDVFKSMSDAFMLFAGTEEEKMEKFHEVEYYSMQVQMMAQASIWLHMSFRATLEPLAKKLGIDHLFYGHSYFNAFEKIFRPKYEEKDSKYHIEGESYDEVRERVFAERLTIDIAMLIQTIHEFAVKRMVTQALDIDDMHNEISKGMSPKTIAKKLGWTTSIDQLYVLAPLINYYRAIGSLKGGEPEEST